MIQTLLIYLGIIILSVLTPLMLPSLFHSPEELSKYPTKKAQLQHLLWKDILLLGMLGSIMATAIMFPLATLLDHNPLLLLLVLAGLIIFALSLINRKGGPYD